MTVVASILIFFLTFGLAVNLQLSFYSLKKKHLVKMTQLELIAKELLKSQDELGKKVVIMENFHNQYMDSQQHLNNEILALTYQILEKYNKK